MATVKGTARARARKAIAGFVEDNIPRFNGWLDEIARGIPQYDGDGNIVKDLKGSVVYLVKPDPAQAMKLVVDICEYHLPKLSRSDVSVVARIEAEENDLSRMNMEQLHRRMYQLLLIDPTARPLDLIEGDCVDLDQVEIDEPVAVPDWLRDG